MLSRSLFSRQATRTSRTFIRNNSTQQKAQEKASEVASKAQDQARAAASKASAAVSGITSRASSLAGGVFGLQEPIVYWSKVTGQLAKQVYQAEKMSPPSMAQIETTYKSLFKSISTGQLMSSAKNMSTKDAVKLGVDGLVIYGFFVVGEMVGRRHLVGYEV
ncbi:putative Mitochondrial F1F0-ATP synthase g subunit [Taphrina deformans PYCC 5710]|uniref:Mitochondrial F1F0-ATP synthase g subunit n=1 Tax=Taphrina deformans (strain PYCC 5710 / ATCC 11124 / CBS 356.35 / IMI 108563 / JCM 9778 / NBRC 8474) TaxID=1097556 RepID=R4XB33_TAPDE|nr:putative Mitochondrial F1F0-ATP synthase g subunit [Taphrina deformans PYCC 5710]|eukprot:CCG81538.1 putative Mitochondrial F1F0-ATP synthase g subunit [Taphrina deformans PYCC 5710]